jgi:hypothetical protein
MTLEQRIKLLEDRFAILEKSDRYTFQKTIEMLDGRKIQVGRSTGTTIATSATQKLSVFGVTPVIQAGSISTPSGGATIDSQSRAAISSIITAIKNFGITA